MREASSQFEKSQFDADFGTMRTVKLIIDNHLPIILPNLINALRNPSSFLVKRKTKTFLLLLSFIFLSVISEAQILGPSSACPGVEVVYSTTATSVCRWSISPSDAGIIIGSTTSSTVRIVFNNKYPQARINLRRGIICSASDEFVIPIRNLTASISGPTSFCTGQGVTLNAYNEPGYSIQWFKDDTFVGSGTSLYVSSGGAYSIQVSYSTRENRCPKNSAPHVVTETQLTPNIISNRDQSCQGGTTDFLTEPGMTSYEWTVSGGTIIMGQGTNKITVDWPLTSTSADVSVSYTDGTCIGSRIVSVPLNSSPHPTVSEPVGVCSGSTGNVYTTEMGMS
ncbi:hypothetical protein, partial [Chryseosolibacter indicus]